MLPPPKILSSDPLVEHIYDSRNSSHVTLALCRDCLHFQRRDNPIGPNRLTIPPIGPQIQLSHLKTLAVTNGTAVGVLAARCRNFSLPFVVIFVG